jgi:DnaJ-class molecular chaperone
MRCPQCNKFVSFDTDAEPEEESTDVDGTDFTATYRRVLMCAECGDELKEASIELTHDFDDAIEEPDNVKDCDACDGEGTVKDKDCEACGGSGKIYEGRSSVRHGRADLMGRELRVVEIATGKAVHVVAIHDGASDRYVEKVEMGLLRRIDLDRFCVEDSKDDSKKARQ